MCERDFFGKRLGVKDKRQKSEIFYPPSLTKNHPPLRRAIGGATQNCQPPSNALSLQPPSERWGVGVMGFHYTTPPAQWIHPS
jgi:hypothetical protein